MATGFTAYFLETYILPQFQGAGVTAPDFWTLDLTSNIPAADGTSTILTAGVAPGYAQLVIDAVPAEWEFIGGNRKMGNKVIKLFPKAAGASWPSVQGFQIGDGTSPCIFGHVSQGGRIIDDTQRFKILPQGLQIRIPDTQRFASDAFCAVVLGLLQGNNITALTDYTVDFGTADPTSTGDINVLTSAGYAPLTVTAATDMGVPAARQVLNTAEFGHLRMFTTEVDVESIKSAQLSVAGTPWLRGPLTAPISLKAFDNPRIEIGALAIKG